MPPLSDEMHYRLLKVLEGDPNVSQRRIAKELNISLGKVNYCLKALIERGLVKAKNFRNNQNKPVYTYLLTPKGKLDEYQRLLEEIDILRREVAKDKELEDIG
jgi:EPS-associated MarR family transcriptional regulator